MNSLTKISAIDAFSDNYIWAVHNHNHVAFVDPGDAAACIRFLEETNLVLNTMLITHHHADHTGGIIELVAYCAEKNWPVKVYGPTNDNIPEIDIRLIENNNVYLPSLNITFQVIDIPGHTLGHIAFYSDDTFEPILFCGDTLFSGGCGRIFEGTPLQMHNSLTKLANLPDNTQVYCAHEYTQANLKFALTVEPTNNDLVNYSNHVNELRLKNMSSIPTSIKVEKEINPFLRCHFNSLKEMAIQFDNTINTDTLAVFTTIRRWKDQF